MGEQRAPWTWDAAGYDADFSVVTASGAVLLDLLAAQPGERVLDVGCGTGHQAAALAAQGVEVLGVDADPAMLDVARAEHPGLAVALVDAQDATALEAAVGPEPVDAVLSNAALHWMPRQDEVLAALARVLRPGGRLVAEMGGHGNVAAVTAAVRAARGDLGLDPDVPSSWTFPTPAEQAARLERAGYVVRLLRLVDRVTPLDPGVTPARWAAVFGAALVADVRPDAWPAFGAAVDARARERGLDRRPDGAPGWWADYVRLRFVAARA